MELIYVNDTVFNEIEKIKRNYFQTHVDEPVVFHRKELVNKRYPFRSLQDKNIEKAFNRDIIKLIGSLEYTVLTVVIDKLEHKTRYKIWQQDPYHYCLRILLERFVLYLQALNAVGDVMAESRGGKEDRRLKKSYSKVYDEGTEYVTTELFSTYLTSRQLKVKQKGNNIAGLQIADLIAHPSFKATVARRNKQSLPANFGGKIAEILEKHKYYRSPQGKIDGWGRKFLP